MSARVFTRQIFTTLAGFLIWFAHFNFIYGVHALVCARGFAGVRVLGMDAVDFSILIATLIALAGTLWVLRSALRRGEVNSLEAAGESSAAFMRFLAITIAAGAVIAILWSALPALLIGACA